MKSTKADNSAQKIASILFEKGAIAFRLRQPFRFASGILSPIYVDNRYLISLPKERKLVINTLVEKIKKTGKFDVIAGTATAGIPHAAWVSEKLNLPMVYVRSKPKEHGKGNQVEGILRRGQKVLVIEDLVSTGGSSIEVVKALRKLGAKADHVFAIYSHNLPESAKNFKSAKVNLHYLASLSDVADIARKKGFLQPGDIPKILDWAKDPKNWGKKRGYE
jgi:orotate phosphoribosyltransferase